MIVRPLEFFLESTVRIVWSVFSVWENAFCWDAFWQNVFFLCLLLMSAHCNTLRHAATHCNKLQPTAVLHCPTLHHVATRCNTLEYTATYCKTLAIHCNKLQHTAAASQDTSSHTHNTKLARTPTWAAVSFSTVVMFVTWLTFRTEFSSSEIVL